MRPAGGDDDRRPTRPPQSERVAGPQVPDDVQFSDLDRAVRARLRTLSKENAQQVGAHLVMTGRLLDSDPELAYEHAQAAVRRAGRVDVVREAAGLAAYRTGRYAEALRELRTVRRLNGSSEHLAVMADCERGLGRPERAIALAASDEAEGLDPEVRVELAMVVSGARLDLGEPEAALAVLSSGPVTTVPAAGVLAARVAQARAAALEALGRPDDAAAELARFSTGDLAAAAGEVEEDVVVFDLAEDEDMVDEPGTSPDDVNPADEPATSPDDVNPAGEPAASSDVTPGAEPATVADDVTVGDAGEPEGSDHVGDPADPADVVDVADALAEAQSEGADVETPSGSGSDDGDADAPAASDTPDTVQEDRA